MGRGAKEGRQSIGVTKARSMGGGGEGGWRRKQVLRRVRRETAEGRRRVAAERRRGRKGWAEGLDFLWASDMQPQDYRL